MRCDCIITELLEPITYLPGVGGNPGPQEIVGATLALQVSSPIPKSSLISSLEAGGVPSAYLIVIVCIPDDTLVNTLEEVTVPLSN